MPFFICAFFPKKSAAANGAVAIATCVDTRNSKLAEMKATMALEESFPDTTDNFSKPKTCELTAEINGRPPIDEFSEHWLECNEWNEETKTFVHIPTVNSDDDPLSEIDPLADARVIFDLPVGERVSYITMYGATPDEIDPEHLSNAVDMFIDDEAPDEIRMIIDGMLKVPSINTMLPTSVAEIIDLIRAVLPPVESVEEVAKLAVGYAKKPAERGEQVERNKTGIARTYDLLDTEAALHVMGIRPSEAKAADIRSAKYLKEDRDAAWRAWSTEYRIIPGILDFDPDELFELMADGHRNLKLVTDHEARRAYVRSKLVGHPMLPNYHADGQPEIKNLGKGQFTVEALADNGKPASNEGEKTEVVTTSNVTRIDAKQAGAETKPAKSETETTKPAPELAIGEAKPAEPITQPVEAVTTTDDFKQRAAALEKGLSEKSEEILENLHIWKQVQSTDPRYTKPLEGAGFAGTSINAEYMFMRATEIFGPVGTGWGYEIIEDRMLNGAPLSEQIYENNKFVRNVLLRDADGTLLFEQNHVLRIKFWYVIECDVRGELEAYGSTPYMYKTTTKIKTDGETHKKSLTDAIKKALSMLGFSADVWLGWHDIPDYLADNAIEYGIKNASDKAEDVVRLRKELDDKFTANTETMRAAVTANEVTKIASSLTRTVGVHIKSAKGINDTEYVRYLESRLRRLEEIKTECLAKFAEEVKA